MGLRREHLAGLVRRGQENEAMLRLFVVEELSALIDQYLESPEKADKALEIFESLQSDEGKYQYAEFKVAMKDALSGDLSPPPKVKRRMDRYLAFLFPE